MSVVRWRSEWRGERGREEGVASVAKWRSERRNEGGSKDRPLRWRRDR